MINLRVIRKEQQFVRPMVSLRKICQAFYFELFIHVKIFTCKKEFNYIRLFESPSLLYFQFSLW